MKNLYVGDLPNSITEAELRNLFEAHGAVEKITLVTDRETGRSRGFGFVEMTNATEADKGDCNAQWDRSRRTHVDHQRGQT
jgi:RNA recognition motif-containing protein